MWNKETREWEFPKYDHLQDAVKRFFEILDTKEVTMSGKEFHPNSMDFSKKTVISCRVRDSAELANIFEQMQILSGYRQAKEMKDLEYMKYDGQTIEEILKWIEDNPSYFDGVRERLAMIKEMQENPYAHYYGYNRPID